MNRALGAVVLTIALSSTSSADEPHPRSGDEETAQESRPLAPTEEELEAYSLAGNVPKTVVDESSGSPLFRLAGWGIVAASAADLATTEMGLAAGMQEANPIASNRGARVLHHVVGPAAVWWTTERLERSGRTKLALSLRIALMAAYGYATLHNTRRLDGRAP